MAWAKDLVVVGADADVLAIARTIITQRGKSLGIRPVRAEKSDFIRDVLHDSSPPDAVAGLLRGYTETHHHAVALRDLEGSGYERKGAGKLAADIETALSRSGWGTERIGVIVIEPEVERWLRLESVHFEKLVRENVRRGRFSPAALRAAVESALQNHGGVERDDKPVRPKEVFLDILGKFHIPQSSSLYAQLAARESLKGCTVPSFIRFLEVLRCWFPAS